MADDDISLPPPYEQFVDPATGQIKDVWYRVFSQLVLPFSQPESKVAMLGGINYNDTTIGSSNSVLVGTLPAGCMHTQTMVRVRTTFNATDNKIFVGTTADNSAFVSTQDVDPKVAGFTICDRGVGADYTADTPVYVQYVQSGSTATQGQVDVALVYYQPG